MREDAIRPEFHFSPRLCAIIIKIIRITVSSASSSRLGHAWRRDCVRDLHAHERARQLSRALARSLVRCEECACRKGTNSQVSADDGNLLVRGIVAKLERLDLVLQNVIFLRKIIGVGN